MNLENYIPASLGIECGGTRTSVCFLEENGNVLNTLELGPANYRIALRSIWFEYFRRIRNTFPQPKTIGLAVSGARQKQDHEELAKILSQFYPNLPHRVSHDLESAFWSYGNVNGPRLVCISGTGSCCYSIDDDGNEIRAGGWGHILGDQGSGYAIGHQLLRKLTFLYDSSKSKHSLCDHVLDALNLPDWESLVDYTLQSGKENIASLAPICIDQASKGDSFCLEIIKSQAHAFADQARYCLNRLQKNSSDKIDLCLQGSILKESELFRDLFINAISESTQQFDVIFGDTPSYLGTLHMARMALANPDEGAIELSSNPVIEEAQYFAPSLDDLGQSPTELRNPESSMLDKMSIEDGIQLFLNQDKLVPQAIEPHKSELVTVIDQIANAFKSGSRLFYVGAGTSGRLGVLDASECPPTFRTPAHWVQGIIAGGNEAMFKSFEGAEDSFEMGIQSALENKIQEGDVVVGIAASGRTPYVWGSLKQSKIQGAYTVLLTFNPNLSVPENQKPDQLIAINVGPELLTGSTRLKSGTATKLVLNMLTTLSMVQIGKVVENLMVDLNPSNEKLKARAIRIVFQLTQGRFSNEECEKNLIENRWVIKDALESLGSR